MLGFVFSSLTPGGAGITSSPLKCQWNCEPCGSGECMQLMFVGRWVNCYIGRVWELLFANCYTVCNFTSDADVLC